MRLAAGAALPRPLRRLRRGRARGVVARRRRGDPGRVRPAHRPADRRQRQGARLRQGRTSWPPRSRRRCRGRRRRPTTWSSSTRPTPSTRPTVGRGPRPARRAGAGWSRAPWSSSSGRRAARSRPGRHGHRRPRASKRYGETTLWYGHAAANPEDPRGGLMRRAVCPGSFDPVTNGHLDIVRRASALFDEVVVAVGVNMSKSRLFTRRGAARDARAGRPPTSANVTVAGFTGLITDVLPRARGAGAIVKGLRAGTDFDYELQMAQMNAHLTDIETVFVPADPQFGFVVVQPGQGGRGVRRRRLRRWCPTSCSARSPRSSRAKAQPRPVTGRVQGLAKGPAKGQRAGQFGRCGPARVRFSIGSVCLDTGSEL